MGLSGLDIAVGASLILSAVIALARGLVTEVLSLASWGGAVILTMFLYRPLASWVMTWLNVEWLAQAVSIAFLFFFSLMLLRIIVSKIGALVKSSNLGLFDRALGAAFGVLRGFVLISFAFLIYTLIMQPKAPPSWIAEAKTGPSIMSGADLLAQVIYGGEGGESPSEVIERLKKDVKDIAVKNALQNTGYEEVDRGRLEQLTKESNSN